LFDRALLGRALLGRALLGLALLGRVLLGRALLGRALLGRALLGRTFVLLAGAFTLGIILGIAGKLGIAGIFGIAGKLGTIFAIGGGLPPYAIFTRIIPPTIVPKTIIKGENDFNISAVFTDLYSYGNISLCCQIPRANSTTAISPSV
jgi:hypothetical protein